MSMAQSRSVLHARQRHGYDQNGGACMKVLIRIDPHKASIVLAVVDEAVGEFVERASFPHKRTGLRALERWAKRFPSVVGPSRTPVVSADTCPRGWQRP